ncbi:methylated-DNA--[protein]-cysteine S-methyltransferase [Lysinibacillus piscis]|uniref:Methylated-DNA--protein-cysteine methyltransferase n=1 Tax=Lysinibacillus piscis TaxID=2518931 RepID=A0ABQ5NFH3_9BACI|nr:methylated-DNA--[protein]-cysteine S-methyltransferase [Lysinibacillus sp. KH24]GLC87035.1 methylated-DNA--protein-cysteine methyltransferase [Lysinibacillus sp. KH24]
MTAQYRLDYQSPLGILELVSSDTEIYALIFVEREHIVYVAQEDTPQVLLDCYQQIHEYFLGERQVFTVPYCFEGAGTAFQQKVWQALTTVAYGQTASYKDIAQLINNEKAVRAVGGANNKNELTIIVPCHRVIGANGTLTGYGGGIWRKEWLLQHEQKFSSVQSD